MKISTFIQIYDNRVWNALTKEFLILYIEELEFIKRYKDKKIEDGTKLPSNLLKQNIITTEQDEKKLIQKLKEITRDNQIQSLYLISSTACNLDCDYCFYRSSASNSLEHRQNMDY